MVEWSDGATIAQLSMPDMRLPIGYAPGVAGPARRSPFGPRRLERRSASLTFEAPDRDGFPCLGLAYAAGRAGGWRRRGSTPPTRSRSHAFLDGRIAWIAIADVIEATVGRACPRWSGGRCLPMRCSTPTARRAGGQAGARR